jgi:hypothetical protein
MIKSCCRITHGTSFAQARRKNIVFFALSRRPFHRRLPLAPHERMSYGIREITMDGITMAHGAMVHG